MQIDINEVLANMLGAIKNSVKEDWPLVKTAASGYVEDKKLRLELLMQLRLANDINDDVFLARLADEKDILVSELHSIAILSKVAAQNAANAALDVLSKAVDTALKLI
ncbi:hypothetical protein A0256_15410 [Mucilaginibacter sp. PAMC 26640]|nr:hypothetical protein A0256_15410 [Mucilaginibacter sp. PAMC 26640]